MVIYMSSSSLEKKSLWSASILEDPLILTVPSCYYEPCLWPEHQELLGTITRTGSLIALVAWLRSTSEIAGLPIKTGGFFGRLTAVNNQLQTTTGHSEISFYHLKLILYQLVYQIYQEGNDP